MRALGKNELGNGGEKGLPEASLPGGTTTVREASETIRMGADSLFWEIEIAVRATIESEREIKGWGL